MFKFVVTCAFVAFISLESVECRRSKRKMYPIPYTKKMQKEIVDYHNEVRSKANPTASNMQKMYWDDTMAKMAQAHSEKCKFEHNSGAERDFNGYRNVGQNLFASSWKASASLPSKSWHSERRWFTYGQKSSKAVGHYTQVIRDAAARIGCGSAYCPNLSIKYFVTCNYLSGNSMLKPYKLGKPCAECPNNCKNNLCDCGGKVCKRDSTLDLNTCKCKCKNNTKGVLCEKLKCKIKERWYCPNFRSAGYCSLRYGYYPQNLCPISCGLCR